MKIYIVTILFLCFGLSSKAEESRAQNKHQTTDSLSLDPSITYGKLHNGFQYYIKPLENSQEQIEIRFIVKAGFNQEDSDQYQLSHFMEHIALKAGKHASTRLLYGSELSRELGISRGSVTAFTARDFTEYILKIPKTKEAMDFAFQIIQDIMSNLEFKDSYIETERAPFIDESEFRGGESSLTGRNFLLDSKVLNCGGNVPEDFFTYIENFPKRKLQRFYKDWYRPDLMGLIVTGDIKDGIAMENQLEEWFSRVPTVKKPRPLINCNESYYNSSPRFVKQKRPTVYKDRYITELFYGLYFKPHKRKSQYDKQSLDNMMKQEVLLFILGERFRNLKEIEGWPFEVWTEFPDDFPNALKVHVKVPENYSKEALTRTIAAFQQIRKHGILPEEFQNAKIQSLQSLKNFQSESKWYWVDEIRKHLMEGEALPEQKNKILITYLEQLSTTDIEDFLNENFSSLPEDIGVIAPAQHNIFQLKEKTLRNWLSNAEKQEVKAYKITKGPDKLMDSISSSELREKNYEEIGTTIPGAKHYKLANGLQLILKSFEPGKGIFIDQEIIRFQGITQKGTKCFPQQKYFSAINAPEIIAQSGVGDFKEWELKRFSRQKRGQVQAYPYINYLESGIRGQASIEELETALQLVYLYFNHPKKDSLSFELWKEGASLRYAENLNRDDFRTHIKSFLNDPDFIPVGTKRIEGIQKTDLDTAYSIYQTIFGRAEDFTFLFSGNFDQERVFQLCNKYLGNLPNIKAGFKCDLVQENTPANKDSAKVKEWESNEIMNNPLIYLIYRTKVDHKKKDWKDETKLAILANFMDVILMKKLRMESEQGGPYVIRATYQYDFINEYNEFIIQYSCNSKDLNRLAIELQEVIENIKQTTLDRNVFKAVINEFMPGEKATNSKMLEKMADHIRYQKKWYTQKELRNYVLSLTPEDIHQVAIDNLKSEPFEFTLIPKNE